MFKKRTATLIALALSLMTIGASADTWTFSAVPQAGSPPACRYTNPYPYLAPCTDIFVTAVTRQKIEIGAVLPAGLPRANLTIEVLSSAAKVVLTAEWPDCSFVDTLSGTPYVGLELSPGIYAFKWTEAHSGTSSRWLQVGGKPLVLDPGHTPCP